MLKSKFFLFLAGEAMPIFLCKQLMLLGLSLCSYTKM